MREGKRALIVDDNEFVCKTVAKILEKMNVEVLSAGDGKKALKLLKKHTDLDIIFLDLFLPGVSGWKLLEELKTGSLTRDIPVVVLSSAPITDEKTEEISKEVAAFVDKDEFDVQSFEKLVRGLLSWR